MNNKKVHDVAEKLFSSKYEELNKHEKHVAHHITERTPISTNVVEDIFEKMTLGQKMADKVTALGGSWGFIAVFFSVMFAWIVLNSFMLIKLGSSFDPYPYILLNLVLSIACRHSSSNYFDVSKSSGL